MTAAVHIPDWDEFDDKALAGSFSVGPEGSVRDFFYYCPCGCGVMGVLCVGVDEKPEPGPSWNWNGSLDRPSLTPSVHHVGHWHGYLTDGEWKSC